MPVCADSSIKRVFVEKKTNFDIEAQGLRGELAEFLGEQYPELRRLRGLRLLNRYDVGRLDTEQFRRMVELVLSEPQCDRVFYSDISPGPNEAAFGVEYLPGQYDQRADSAEQCAELAVGVRPVVRTARIYVLEAGDTPVSAAALEAVKRYLINPVDSREAAIVMPAFTEADTSLEAATAEVPDVPVLAGFCRAGTVELASIRREYGLAMSDGDILFCRDYFRSEGRDPTLAELRVLDTYWSDHCRHTTFTTALEINIDDGAAPDLRAGDGSRSQAAAMKNALALYEAARDEVYGTAASKRKRTLMDMATIGTKVLRKRGLVPDLDESEEINACTVKVTAEFSDGSTEPWLLLFKNETHNHPTEIEPFGGAATCLGGAIRDPLSGRAFVHQAMRVTGAGDPRQRLSETLPGKLPQIKIVRAAAAGYASYGNQIGLTTGQVAEFYHPGFIAKRMELGAVIGAVPAAWVRREEPAAGDVVLLVGGKTGRDGIGGATGSSKVHTGESVETSGAEVQKGNAVEERKLQRLFRNPDVTGLIKRCNDFGAGGVAVAVGELADGLDINLDAVPKKYAGLDGVELAISESQERMAVVVAASDAETFIREAAAENLTAVVIAKVTEGNQISEGDSVMEERVGAVSATALAGAGTGTVAAGTAGNTAQAEAGTADTVAVSAAARLRMFWRGTAIVDLSREFLNSNGAPRSAVARIAAQPADTANSDGSGERPDLTGPAVVVNGSSAALSHSEPLSAGVLLDTLERELVSLRSGSRRGLQERFDGSVGAASVLFPWGGETQGTAECGMAALLPALGKQSRTASLMTFGYDPELSSRSPSSLLHFVQSNEKNRPSSRFSPCKLRKEPFNSGFFAASSAKNLQAQQAPRASCPYEGAKGAIREALAKFACLGGDPWTARLSLQEYFERTETPESWGKPAAALLGALEAQLALGVPAIGGKDSMSGSYRDESRGIDIAVPPTLVAFAAGTAPAGAVRSGTLSGTPRNLIILLPQTVPGTSEWDVFKRNMNTLADLTRRGMVRAAYPVGPGGVAASLAVMAFGNMTGIEVYTAALGFADHAAYQGSILIEIDGEAGTDTNTGNGTSGRADTGAKSGPDIPGGIIAARIIAKPVYRIVQDERPQPADKAYTPTPYKDGSAETAAAEVPLLVLRRAYEGAIAQVYPQTSTGAAVAEPQIPGQQTTGLTDAVTATSPITAEYRQQGPRPAPRIKHSAAPLVVLPVFPGTNCEWDMERAFLEAGARTRLVVFRNRNREDILEATGELAAAIRESQIVALSGGFSAGDEPDGSGKFIANVFRAPAVADATADLLENRDGLMLGICNGFQALIKLGLVPYGKSRDPSNQRSVNQSPAETMPTLTFNRLGRHVSRMVRTRVMSNRSPWLALEDVGALHVIPVSHGEGRIVISPEEAAALFNAGQIPCCYADAHGSPTMAEPDNPNGSAFAIEALTSPDGRVLGKMAHSERRGNYVHINIPGNKEQRLFEAGVKYFK